MDGTFHAPMKQLALRDIVEEYDLKHAAADENVKAIGSAIAHLESESAIGGKYVGRFHDCRAPSKIDVERNLLKSAWRHVYDGLQIEKLATAKERQAFDRQLESPPPFTLDNIRATFGDYVIDPRYHILRGLAECFAKLDPAFKSHTNVKVGVDGLPKRIIIQNVAQSEYSEGYGAEYLKDTLNAIRVYEEKPQLEYAEWHEMLKEARRTGTADLWDGIELRLFKNGNGHLHFAKHALDNINRALAEFYGEVLPDTPEAAPDAATGRPTSSQIAKDLQFYRTPDAIADIFVHDIIRASDQTILEPSCGDGSLLEAMVRRHAEVRTEQSRMGRDVPTLKLAGIEVDRDRALAAEAKRFPVTRANFLELEPVEEFDAVVMNPPFYGQHWKKHVRQGLAFCKPSEPDWAGNSHKSVHCILPTSALIDGHLDEFDHGEWKDFPTGAFRESGTNIPTGYVTIWGVK